MKTEHFDFIIVGAGAAGAVVASRIAQTGQRVLLLEAGGSDLIPQILIPAGMLKMPRSKYWQYDVEPDPTRYDRTDSWAAGKVVGGGSSVNAMLWVRGNARDFDEWAELGAEGWDHESLLPLMKEMENFRSPDASRHRGRTGPQSVTRIGMKHPLVSRWIDAATEAGHPYNDDYNGPGQLGVSWAQVSQRRGVRQGTGRSYLSHVRWKSNFQLLTHATALRVIFEGQRAVGVEYERRGRVRRALASREVILSGGALESPALLLRSGVGPAQELEELGIPLVADVPAVGRNLQEHPTISMTFDVIGRTLNQETSPLRVTKHGLNYVVRGRGPGASSLTHAMVFGVLDGGTARPTYQVMIAPLATASKPHATGEELQTGTAADPSLNDHAKQDVKLAKSSTVSCFISVLHPRSRGSVTLRASGKGFQPVIRFPFFGDPEDLSDLVSAARAVRDIFASAAIRDVVVGENEPTAELHTDEEWEAFARETSYSASHWTCTVRMGGVDDPAAAVDPRLRVKGVKGLRVIDASVMPTVTSGNTNAPTILIGEKGARMIMEDNAL